MNTYFRILTFFTFMLLLSCGGTVERQKLETLNSAIDDYAYALRWGRTDDAVSYHVNEDGSQPGIDSSIMDSVRVTGFEIRERTVNPEQTEATVKGELNYYHDNSATLRTLEYDQHWWYEPESKQWLLDSDFPEF
ncbi:MAG: hypothetical protein HKN08_08445 [Gammaproteobacteria bacterium]|nr:hypothetical protein [Gammaproteobacteria bacterium]